jgi:hypothetical protein
LAAATPVHHNGSLAPAAYMNQLFVGFNKTIEPPKRGLFIHDEVPDISRARIFDPAKHSFNPLKDIDYRKARALADLIYTIYTPCTAAPHSFL